MSRIAVWGLLAVFFWGGAALAQDIPGPGATIAPPSGTLSPGTGPQHGIAMHGTPKYPAGYSHFDYAEPLATEGGDLSIAEIGTYDSLNPFIITGTPAWPVYYYVAERLMARADDEAFTLYGRIAESIETPEDRSWVTFRINPNAAFSDGSPITAADVIFSWEIFKLEGRPNMRNYYSRVAEVRTPDERTVQFIFDPEQANRELPLIMGLMPVISASYYAEHEFNQSTLDIPLGSGPYMVDQADAGTRLVLRRNPDYWGADEGFANGRFNFDRIVYDYYRDTNAAFEAFKAGDVDVWVEADAGRWSTSYNVPAVRTGRILRREFDHGRPSGMYGFVFNTRRDIFSDVRVREAITIAFDFDWVNANLYHNAYVRTRSFWDNSELGALASADAAERALIAVFPGSVSANILDAGWVPPLGGDRANLRENLRRAVELLAQAGYGVDDQRRMVNLATGAPLAFEIMLQNRNDERLALNLRDTLENIGIAVNVRLVDAAQFQSRSQTHGFDMMPFRYSGSLSPGNEQTFRYGSREASIEGTYNFAGVRSAAVDAHIQSLTDARTREDLITATRALDRTLLSGFYVIPLYYQAVDRIAYWGAFDHPEDPPASGYASGTWFHHTTWWHTPDN